MAPLFAVRVAKAVIVELDRSPVFVMLSVLLD